MKFVIQYNIMQKYNVEDEGTRCYWNKKNLQLFKHYTVSYGLYYKLQLIVFLNIRGLTYFVTDPPKRFERNINDLTH